MVSLSVANKFGYGFAALRFTPPLTMVNSAWRLTMTRQNISSGAQWEDIVGYSRAVRVGNVVEVAGTTAVSADGSVFAPGDPYQQTLRILSIIEGALAEAGASLSDVVRSRIFVTDISQWEAVGRAHGEYFRDIKPAATMVEVTGLIDPDMMVEIEVVARISDS